MSFDSEDVDLLKKISPQQVHTTLLIVARKLKLPLSIWKNPAEEEWHAFLGNSSVLQEEAEIEQLGAGFIVNKFANKGLDQAIFIQGNIYYSSRKHSFSFDLAMDEGLKSDFLTLFFNPNSLETQFENTLNIPEKTTVEGFKEYVVQSVAAIGKGDFQKVVLARRKEIKLPPDFNVEKVFEKLSSIYSNAFVSLIYHPDYGTWIGASPEILISIKDNLFKTCALAGTQSGEGKGNLKEVLWSQKEIEEQAMVTRYIIKCFKRIRLREYEEEGPKTVRAGNLLHLRTDLIVDLSAVEFPQLGSMMVDLLHPTSAVCGMPHKPALDFILQHEQFDRELYAGFLGPVNFDNSTSLFVNLRCMKIEGEKGILFAGAGITEDSQPDKEWLETEMKFNTMLNVIS